MDIPNLRTWAIFYLISFVVLLWALFLTTRGVLLWMGLMLVIVVVGINGVVLAGEVRGYMARRHRLKQLTMSSDRDVDAESRQ